MPERTLNAAELRAIVYLRTVGRDGATADFVGDAVWPERKGRITSSGGGGDYAAQMLLGRLRKRGLAEVVAGEGASRWALTGRGIHLRRAMALRGLG